MGLALWLVPAPGGLTTALGEEIQRLRADNDDCSGEFGLHATLVAGLGDRTINPSELHDLSRKIVSQWKQNHANLEVGLKNVETKGTYFQCIVVSLVAEKGLLDLYNAAKDAVDEHFPPPNAQQRQEYFPHISMLYAPLSAAQAQTQIDAMQQRGVFNHTAQGIAFQGHTSVQFASLDIVDCTGKPEDWRTLHSIPL